MPSKLQIIKEMAAREALSITSNTERFIAFLHTAANNYKYDFQEQLLIHAQKPDATACAEIDTWNKLGRWVNKGTRGIALLIDRDVPYKLRYVFDLSDTNKYGIHPQMKPGARGQYAHGITFTSNGLWGHNPVCPGWPP